MTIPAPGEPAAKGVTPWVAVLVVAAIAFGAAYFSPVKNESSDAAIALVAAQSLLEHRTLTLDPYVGDPRCVYDLEADRRVVERRGSLYYHSVGLQLLSVPAVWAANRLGWDMLDPAREHALQNLLSALSCGAGFVLLYLICRQILDALSSLLIASVSVFGSSLLSTLGTALWSSNLLVLLLGLALLHLVKRRNVRVDWRFVGLLVAIGFVVRPTAIFFAMALFLSTLSATPRRLALGVALVLLSVLAVLGLGSAGFLDWLPDYYSWRKIRPAAPVLMGLSAHLISPSRGIFVFSPFLIVVAGAVWTSRRALFQDRLARLCVFWIALHLVAVSFKNMWWGGHSYGPRLLTELVPGFLLLAALAWRELSLRGDRQSRNWAGAFLVLALPALWINSYQGLFNPAVVRWNEEPNIDSNSLLVFDWNHPQFLASEESVEERHLSYQVNRLRPLPWELEIEHDDWRHLAFSGWSEIDRAWRWSDSKESTLVFLLYDLDRGSQHLLEVNAGAQGRQSVAVSFNGEVAGVVSFEGFESQRQVLPIDPTRLLEGQNRVRFDIPGAGPVEGDARDLGLALRSVALHRVAEDLPVVRFDDNFFFGRGFSSAEAGWRWTVAKEATIFYAVGSVDPSREYTMRLLAGVHDRQRVAVRVNDAEVGQAEWKGFQPSERTMLLPARSLLPNSINEIRFSLPDASRATGDPRLLGMAVVELRLEVSTGQGD